MKRLALVDTNGLIVNIVSVPDDWTDEDRRWQPPGHLSVVDAPDAAPGDTWDGSKRVRKQPQPPPARTVPSALLDGTGSVTRAEINALKAHLRGDS